MSIHLHQLSLVIEPGGADLFLHQRRVVTETEKSKTGFVRMGGLIEAPQVAGSLSWGQA